jgi:2-oxoglutarate dehydrogenase complex dehydrogenase (E1) component-like enzyme
MSEFEKAFLENYLKFGLGSLPKSDIDALVMHLLDQHGQNGSGPLAGLSNQVVSERLRTPVTKIRKLRYDAALKFGGRIEDQAMGRLLAALSKASLEAEGKKICLIIEDSLAKNWLQGQLKIHQQIFDHSFNTEIIKVDAEGLFEVLETCFYKDALKAFRAGYDTAKTKKSQKEMKKAFASVAKKFAEGAAKAAGAGVVAVLKAHMGTP